MHADIARGRVAGPPDDRGSPPPVVPAAASPDDSPSLAGEPLARPFNTHDDSRNNAIFGILAFGEGWHNTHHAFPTSARHGLEWWQIDVGYLVIRTLALLGLARDIKLPSPERIAAKRVVLRHDVRARPRGSGMESSVIVN